MVTCVGSLAEQVAQPAQLVRVVPVHPHAEPDRLLGLARGVGQHALLAERHEPVDAVGLDVALRREAEVALDVDLDPQALAVEAVLVALVLAEHRVEALVEVLVGAAPGVVDAHRVVGGDRPVEEAPARAAGVLGAQPGERAPLAATGPRSSCSWATRSGFELTGRNIRLRAQGWAGDRARRPAGHVNRRVRVSYPRCRHRRRRDRAPGRRSPRRSSP